MSFLQAEVNWEPLNAELIEGARRLPVEIKQDLEMAYFESLEITEQSVRDMLLIDSGQLGDSLGITTNPLNTPAGGVDIVIDERHTLPVQAYEAKQTPEGVEVYVVRGAEPMIYRKAFLYRGGIYVRVNRRAIKKVGDVQIWDWAGPRRMAEELPETILAKFGRLFNNTFEILFGKGSKA